MKKRLSAIAHIRSGLTLRGNFSKYRDGLGKYCYLKISDLSDNGTFNSVHSEWIDLDAKTFERGAVYPGDVLIASRGSRTTAGIYKDEHKAVAGGQFFILSLKSNQVDPEYLVAYLNLPDTQKRLSAEKTGTFVQGITKNVLSEMEIPLPPLDKQRSFSILFQLTCREKEILLQLANLRSMLLFQKQSAQILKICG